MKKVFLIVFLIIAIKLFAQQIPNSDFENWSGNNSAEGWTCAIYPSGVTINTAQRTGDAHSGDYAAKLVTQTIITGDVVPGMIMLGQLDLDELEPVGGIPFSAKPTAFEVYLKFNQQANDSLVVFCELTRYDSVSHQTITLGGSYYVSDQAIEDYTLFLFPIYYVAEGQPDTINIGFFSSNMQPHPGSTLWVDDLHLLYGDYLLPPQANNPENVTIKGFEASWIGSPYTKKYYLDVAKDNLFTDFLSGYENKDVGDTDRIYVNLPDDIDVNEVYYRVRADYDTVISENSNVISVPVVYPPTLLSPENVSTTAFTVKWKKNALVTQYIFDLSKDSLFHTFIDPYFVYFTPDTLIQVVGLERNTNYYYRVRAMYYGGYKSDFSDTMEVTTAYTDAKRPFQFFILENQILIYCREDMLNSTYEMYNVNGRLLKKGIITDRFTYIDYWSIGLLLFKFYTPDGQIINQKVVKYDVSR